MEKTHKEKLEYLKKHDPILYSELTSDPCGDGGDSWDGFFAVMFVAILIALGSIIVLWLIKL